MSGRVIAQIILTGTQIVGKAFVEAYRVAAAEAAKNASKSAIKPDADPITQKTGITIDEACLILNIKKDAPLEKVLERYETLFKLNDSKAGGSHYLQSKIYRAKERLEMEIGTPEEPQSSTENSM